MKGALLYDFIIITFFIAFVGYTMFAAIDWLNPVWFGSLALGIVLFCIRIAKGHD